MATTNGRLPKHRKTERIIEETLRRVRNQPVVAGGGGSGGSGGSTFVGPFVPTRVFAGTAFVVPADTQVLAALPIVIEPGAILDVIGALVFVT